MKKQKAPKPLIEAATIARAFNRATGETLGFAVKANSSNKFHQVRFYVTDDGQRHYSCDCTSATFAFHNCQQYGHCCHIEAVIQTEAAAEEIAIARALVLMAEARAAYDMIELVEEVVAEEEVSPAEIVAQRVYNAPATPRVAEDWGHEDEKAAVKEAERQVAEKAAKDKRAKCSLNNNRVNWVNGIPM